MPAQDFEGILLRVQRASFDHARAPLVRQALVGHHLGSDMLRQLLEAFDYDSNRLPVAIDAYDQIADPYNYISVADAFDYSSTRAQLMDHLAKHPISSLHCWGGGMAEQDFALILARVQKASFDSDRLPLVRQALVGGYLRADMLRRLLRAFNYDSNRLTLARYAYPHIADPYNYAVVGDAFDYPSNARALQDYIVGQR